MCECVCVCVCMNDDASACVRVRSKEWGGGRGQRTLQVFPLGGDGGGQLPQILLQVRFLALIKGTRRGHSHLHIVARTNIDRHRRYIGQPARHIQLRPVLRSAALMHTHTYTRGGGRVRTELVIGTKMGVSGVRVRTRVSISSAASGLTGERGARTLAFGPQRVERAGRLLKLLQARAQLPVRRREHFQLLQVARVLCQRSPGTNPDVCARAT
jgi:hypothetical protein